MSYIKDILKTSAFAKIGSYERMMCQNVFRYLKPADNGFLFFGQSEPRFQWDIINRIADYVMDIEGSIVKLRRRSTLDNLKFDYITDGSFDDLGALIKEQFPDLYVEPQPDGPEVITLKIKRRI
jgi:hypothetical protein